MPTLKINPHGLEKLKKLGLYPNESCLARRLGVSTATTSRVVRGLSEPGPRVVAGAIQAFGQSMFFELFDVVGD